MSNPYSAPQSNEATPRTAEPVFNPPDHATIMGHPVGLFLLFVVEMWERFSYYGMRALLPLYLAAAVVPIFDPANPTNYGAGRGWTEGEASVLYGWYTGLAYLLPIAGGLIADRLIGNNRSLLIGGTIIALGHIVLGVSGLGDWATNDVGMSLFIGGLVMIIIGTGHFKPCVSSIVGQLYGEGDPRRDAAYTIFYMGINLGALLGTLLCGIISAKYGWHWGFGLAAIGMVAGLIAFMLLRKRYLGKIGEPPAGKGRGVALMWIPIAILASIAVALIYHAGTFSALQRTIDGWKSDWPYLTTAFSVGMLTAFVLYAVAFTMKMHPGEKGPVATIFILMVFNAVFWLAFEQAGSSIAFFAEKQVDRHIAFLDYTLPTASVHSFNPLFILLFGPVMGWIWTALGRAGRNPSQGMKVAIGLALLGAGFLILVLVAPRNPADGKAMLWTIAAMTWFHTIGELCISPTGLSYVTKTAPLRFLALLMGTWFISNFVANLVGGLIAARVKEIEDGTLQMPWELGEGQADFFMLFVVSSFAAAVVALAMTPVLKRLSVKS